MISDKRTANAMGGKTARACDNCLLKRARWYCSSDDAFLCQSCDTSVHSANQLAIRHTRVRLDTSSSSNFNALVTSTDDNNQDGPAAWHRGFTRKPRTPRQKGERKGLILNLVVPEFGCEDGSGDENEEQLLFRVPVFDPFAAELCDTVHGFMPSDLDLSHFAVGIETLLGDGNKVSIEREKIEVKHEDEEEEEEGVVKYVI